MTTTPGEARYLSGYEAGRALCLRTGSSDAGHGWLLDHPRADDAYVAGFEWALWDYEDANGIRPRGHETAHRTVG
ncbi:hypothetical protein [Nocardioides sp. CER19]|uniref:hypothetical protein n=1 Tax=Nocardioides sp. CER19 TaxID=3038538 RepID=UPI00244B21D3|nr:hypothetical protein [Nocardioides sp. CER19]MDH2416235.1 hypothetical protein [Nocardioides sp. CER19]